jgi:chemotaxis protein CheC
MTDLHGSRLAALFRRGAGEAAAALSRWLGRPATIEVREVDLLPLDAAGGVLGGDDAPLCCAVMEVQGALSGILVLAALDAAGLALADLLLARPAGTGTAWGEIERSALAETANIVGCAYLGAIADALPSGRGDRDTETIVPSPPAFLRDYAASLMEALLVDQAVRCDAVFLTRTEFAIDGTPVHCSLVFVPDSESRARIVEGAADFGKGEG